MSIEIVCLLLIAILGIHATMTALYIKGLKNMDKKLNMDITDLKLRSNSEEKRIKNCENAITTLFSDLDKMSDTLIKIVDMDKADSERIDTIIEYLLKHVEQKEDNNEEEEQDG